MVSKIIFLLHKYLFYLYNIQNKVKSIFVNICKFKVNLKQKSRFYYVLALFFK